MTNSHRDTVEQRDPDMQRGFERVHFGFSRDDLDAIGERGVREKLSLGGYGPDGDKTHAFVVAWLKDREFVAAEETRSIAKATALASTVSASEAVRSGDTARKAKTATIIIGIVTIIVAVLALWPKK